MTPKTKRILKSTIGWVLYIAFLVGVVYGTPKALSHLLKTDYPMAAITSGSMWPALKKGDLILIQGVQDRSQISVGDIVVYKNQRGFTIHRVVSMGDTTLVTKGDANNVSDTPVPYSEVVGKAFTYQGHLLKIPFWET